MTACSEVGAMQALFDVALDSLNKRERGGRVVLEFPNVQQTIGEMHVAIETSRATVHRALAMNACRPDPFFDPAATVAKQYVTEQAIDLGVKLLRLHGGEGYMRVYPWERYLRDMLGLVGGQGAQEMLLIQLGQRVITEHDQKRLKMEKVKRVVGDLLESWWGFTVLASAFEAGVVEALLVPRTVEQVGERVGVPVPLVERMLEVLLAMGLVRRDGLMFVLDEGLEPVASGGPVRTALQSELRSTMLQGADFFARARHGTLTGKWDYDDPEIIDAQGAPSAAFCEIILGMLLPMLDGLGDRLQASDGKALDVGTGSGQMAIALCRQLPELNVVGLEPSTASLSLAEENIAKAGLMDRVELRPQRIEDLAEEMTYDFVWLPSLFLGEEGLVRALPRVRQALAPGGWVLLLTISEPGTDLRAAISQFQNVMWGGDALSSADVQQLLADAGFAAIKELPEPLGTTTRFVAARRIDHVGTV
jgi:SAM-dependent methyltransferase